MVELTFYAAPPSAFLFRYARLGPISHAIILTAVLAAVACSVCTQYGVKFLVDTLSSGENAAAWTAFFVLGALIAADNLLWRGGARVAHYALLWGAGGVVRGPVHPLFGDCPRRFFVRPPRLLSSPGGAHPH